LQQQGYRIVPVSPKAGEVLGEQAYPDLPSIPFDIDIVDIFRRSEAVGPHVEEAIQKGASAVWIQLGIRNDEAAQRARDAGFDVVMDHCIKIEHDRLMR
jgi:predicted CoA-binding protein